MTKRLFVAGCIVGATMSLSGSADAQTFKDTCEALALNASSPAVTQATFIAAGPLNFPGPPPVSITAPDHCQIQGALAPRVGIDGKNYAIGYELRLPATALSVSVLCELFGCRPRRGRGELCL